MELLAGIGTISPYENNSLNSDEEPKETSVADSECNIAYELTNVSDSNDEQTADDMTSNPAYVGRKYNRLFGWAKKKQGSLSNELVRSDITSNPAYVGRKYNRLFSWTKKKQGSSSNKLVRKDKYKSFLPMLLLLLLMCLLACSLSVAALALTKIQMESLKMLREEVLNDTDTPEPPETEDPRIEQLVANVTQLYTTQQEIQLKQSIIQASLDNLTAEVNNASMSMPTATTPVSIYQGCYDETTTCIEGGSNYWDQCFTPSQPTNREGLFTMSMHCEQSCNRENDALLKSTYIRPDGQGNVQCACEVTNPLRYSPGHNFINGGLVFTCNLIITRCPIVIQ